MGLFLVIFGNSLQQFGASVITRIDGSPLNDLLKPIHVVAGVMAWMVQLARAPQTGVSDRLARGIVGGLVLIGGLTLWTLTFKGFWRARARARWRRACLGFDVLQSRANRLRSLILCACLLMLGALPLLFVLFVKFTGAVTISQVGEALGAAVALMCFAVSMLFALLGPFGWDKMAIPTAGHARDTLLVQRLLYPLTLATALWLFLRFSGVLWPYSGLTTGASVKAAMWTLHAVSWEAFGIIRLRAKIGVAGIVTMMAIPLAGTAGWVLLGPSVLMNRHASGVFSLLAVMSVAIAALSSTHEIIIEGVPAILRSVRQFAGVLGRR
jgi:hypothetical protein